MSLLWEISVLGGGRPAGGPKGAGPSTPVRRAPISPLAAWMHLHDIPLLWEADDQQPVMNESPRAAESYHACL